MTMLQDYHMNIHECFLFLPSQEQHHNMVRFQLPPHNITVATIFGVMEREKNNLNLEDYSISQTTLDEVSPTPLPISLALGDTLLWPTPLHPPCS